MVGCDGIHSVLRSQYAADNAKFSGRIAYRGLVDIENVKGWWPFKSFSASWLCRGKHLLVFPISQNKLLNVVGFVTKNEHELGDLRESWSCEGETADMKADFLGFETTVQRVIENLKSKPSKWVLNDHEPLPKWVYANGRVVLMGDAAHAMLPHQGTFSSFFQPL